MIFELDHSRWRAVCSHIQLRTEKSVLWKPNIRRDVLLVHPSETVFLCVVHSQPSDCRKNFKLTSSFCMNKGNFVSTNAQLVHSLIYLLAWTPACANVLLVSIPDTRQYLLIVCRGGNVRSVCLGLECPTDSDPTINVQSSIRFRVLVSRGVSNLTYA